MGRGLGRTGFGPARCWFCYQFRYRVSLSFHFRVLTNALHSAWVVCWLGLPLYPSTSPRLVRCAHYASLDRMTSVRQATQQRMQCIEHKAIEVEQDLEAQRQAALLEYRTRRRAAEAVARPGPHRGHNPVHNNHGNDGSSRGLAGRNTGVDLANSVAESDAGGKLRGRRQNHQVRREGGAGCVPNPSQDCPGGPVRAYEGDANGVSRGYGVSQGRRGGSGDAQMAQVRQVVAVSPQHAWRQRRENISQAHDGVAAGGTHAQEIVGDNARRNPGRVVGLMNGEAARRRVPGRMAAVSSVSSMTTVSTVKVKSTRVSSAPPAVSAAAARGKPRLARREAKNPLSHAGGRKNIKSKRGARDSGRGESWGVGPGAGLGGGAQDVVFRVQDCNVGDVEVYGAAEANRVSKAPHASAGVFDLHNIDDGGYAEYGIQDEGDGLSQEYSNVYGHVPPGGGRGQNARCDVAGGERDTLAQYEDAMAVAARDAAARDMSGRRPAAVGQRSLGVTPAHAPIDIVTSAAIKVASVRVGGARAVVRKVATTGRGFGGAGQSGLAGQHGYAGQQRAADGVVVARPRSEVTARNSSNPVWKRAPIAIRPHSHYVLQRNGGRQSEGT